MRRLKLTVFGALALLVCTSTGCRLASLDLDGDGVVTRSEVITAIVDAVCGDETTTDDGTTDEGTTDDGQIDDGTTDGQTDAM
jgi:hypothetical protein